MRSSPGRGTKGCEMLPPTMQGRVRFGGWNLLGAGMHLCAGRFRPLKRTLLAVLLCIMPCARAAELTENAKASVAAATPEPPRAGPLERTLIRRFGGAAPATQVAANSPA